MFRFSKPSKKFINNNGITTPLDGLENRHMSSTNNQPSISWIVTLYYILNLVFFSCRNVTKYQAYLRVLSTIFHQHPDYFFLQPRNTWHRVHVSVNISTTVSLCQGVVCGRGSLGIVTTIYKYTRLFVTVSPFLREENWT